MYESITIAQFFNNFENFLTFWLSNTIWFTRYEISTTKFINLLTWSLYLSIYICTRTNVQHTWCDRFLSPSNIQTSGSTLPRTKFINTFRLLSHWFSTGILTFTLSIAAAAKMVVFVWTITSSLTIKFTGYFLSGNLSFCTNFRISLTRI